MAQLNSLVVTGNSKFISDVNANTINLNVNSVGINFRPTNSGYYTTTSYQTAGNEALVFASKNAVTSFMFVNGEDSITNHGDTRWRSLTPGLQIKNNCVSIGQLIDTNVTPTYKLLVNGTSYFSDRIFAAYKSGTWVNSLTMSGIVIPDNSNTGFGGWICGPTANGRIAIATYQSSDNKLYIGYGARGRTENSYEKVMTWDGSTGYLTANKFIGPLQGNADTATSSDLARRLQWTTVRMTTPNTHWNDAALRYYLSSSAMTTDKPRSLDGKIIHMPWDNDGGYASQMFIAHGQYALAALRCQNGNKDAWGSWMPMGVFSQTTPTSGQVVITDGTNGMIKSSGYTIATSVPSGAVFTDAKVTQTATTTDANYEVLFSATADNTTRTEGARKTTTLRFNPSKGSLMEGDSTVASGTNAHAEGIATTASGDGAHAESIAARATGDGSHAEGNNTSASGQYSHAEGLATNASGARSHAEGQETTASGNCSHATGLCTCAAGANQTVVGKYNVADTSSLFIVGNGTANNARKNALSVASNGTLSLTNSVRKMLTGTGTAAQDKGSGVSPRYFPAKWTFNMGTATPVDGEIVTIKIPVAGHDFGTFLSLDNGTTYKPISVDYGAGRLTTHFPVSRSITLIYDSSGQTNSVYAAAGADARSNITGGCWRVINFYDANTYDRTVYNRAIKAGSTAIANNNIIVGKDGVYHHLKDGTVFDITYPILHAQTNIAANATGSWVFIATPFSIGTTQSMTLTAYLPVYIKGTLNGKMFTPVSTTPLTQTVPTSEDGYYYINLGLAYDTANMFLTYEHKIYAYRYNQFAEITWNSQFTSFLKPIATNTTTGLSTWNIPSGCYQVWGQQFKDNRLTYTPSGGSATTVTDTGDWTMWLAGNGTTNTATFNMRIDGTYYGSFSGNLSGNASSATKATQDGDGKTISSTYLKLSGGTMTGSVSCTTSGANLTWGNITIYGGGSDGGKNSMLIGNDAVIGDCNVGGYFGIKPNASGGTNAGIRLFNNAGTMIGGFGSNNGTPKWINASGTEYPIGFYTVTATSGQVLIADGTGGGLKTSGYTIAKSVPSNADFGNTKNTAGSTDTSSKIFLIGATSQAANPQTYSDNEVYATSGVLTTKSVQVGGTAATMQYNATNHAIEFIVT